MQGIQRASRRGDSNRLDPYHAVQVFAAMENPPDHSPRLDTSASGWYFHETLSPTWFEPGVRIKEGPPLSKLTRNRAGSYLLLIALSVSVACSEGEAPEDESHHPVILVGVDGLEWRVISEMIDDGELPVLTRLMKEGTFGKLKTMRPTWSPVIWTTVATGKIPRKHGILGFTKEEDGKQRLFSNRDRKTKALWNIFSDLGRTVHSVGWWMTFPAEAVRGTMVAQTNTLAQLKSGAWKGSLVRGLPGQVTPSSFHDPVMEIAAEVQESLPELAKASFGEFEYPLSMAASDTWENGLWAFRADTIYLGVVEKLLASDGQPFDLMLVYFGGPDVVGHRFWRYAYPEEFDDPPTPEEQKDFSQVIRNTYSYVDRAIGHILDLVEGEPTVFIVSDHGMHAANREKTFPERRELFSGHHMNAPPGVLIASGKHIRRGSPDRSAATVDLPELGRVLDLAPTILALKGLPIGRDMDGVIMEAILEEGFLESHTPTFVETHDRPEWLDARPDELLTEEAERERLQQLRALGYIQ